MFKFIGEILNGTTGVVTESQLKEILTIISEKLDKNFDDLDIRIKALED